MGNRPLRDSPRLDTLHSVGIIGDALTVAGCGQGCVRDSGSLRKRGSIRQAGTEWFRRFLFFRREVFRQILRWLRGIKLPQ